MLIFNHFDSFWPFLAGFSRYKKVLCTELRFFALYSVHQNPSFELSKITFRQLFRLYWYTNAPPPPTPLTPIKLDIFEDWLTPITEKVILSSQYLTCPIVCLHACRVAWIINCKFWVGGSRMEANHVSIPKEFFAKISNYKKKEIGRGQSVHSLQ